MNANPAWRSVAQTKSAFPLTKAIRVAAFQAIKRKETYAKNLVRLASSLFQ